MRHSARFLTASKLSTPRAIASLTAADTSAERPQQAQDLDELALARLAQSSLEQPAQSGELLGQSPPDQWRRLIQRSDLSLQQRQVV
jgi:hypothetical protein